jgi:hypothetical protein
VSEHLVGNSKDGLFLLVVRKQTTVGEHAFQGGRSTKKRGGLDEQCPGTGARRAYCCRRSGGTSAYDNDIM